MSEFTTPSDVKQRSSEFMLAIAGTISEPTNIVVEVPAPVNGKVIGGAVRCQTADTHVEMTLSYDGVEIDIGEVTLTSQLTYRFNVLSGGFAVERDGGRTAPTAERVLRFSFSNTSENDTSLYVRVDFISAQ